MHAAHENHRKEGRNMENHNPSASKERTTGTDPLLAAPDISHIPDKNESKTPPAESLPDGSGTTRSPSKPAIGKDEPEDPFDAG